MAAEDVNTGERRPRPQGACNPTAEGMGHEHMSGHCKVSAVRHQRRAREGRGASEGQALWRDEEVLERTAFRLDLGCCAGGWHIVRAVWRLKIFTRCFITKEFIREREKVVTSGTQTWPAHLGLRARMERWREVFTEGEKEVQGRAS